MNELIGYGINSCQTKDLIRTVDETRCYHAQCLVLLYHAAPLSFFHLSSLTIKLLFFKVFVNQQYGGYRADVAKAAGALFRWHRCVNPLLNSQTC